jgi:DnaJ-domain-containing protein 1
MTVTEIAAIPICALVGYWAVGAFLLNRSERTTHPKTMPVTADFPADCYAVLAVAPTASAVEIREAYASLIDQYSAKNFDTLGPEFRELAARKKREIDAAFEQAMLCRSR